MAFVDVILGRGCILSNRLVVVRHVAVCLSLANEILNKVLKLCVDFNEHLTLFKKRCELLWVVLGHQSKLSFSLGNQLINLGKRNAIFFHLFGKHELLSLEGLFLLDLSFQLSFLCSLFVLLSDHLLLFQQEILILILLDNFLLVRQLLQLLIVLDDLLTGELLLIFSSGLEELLQSRDLLHQHLRVTGLVDLVQSVYNVF